MLQSLGKRHGETEKEVGILQLLSMVLIPWGFFVTVCLLFMFVYHSNPQMVLFPILIAVLICGTKANQEYQARESEPLYLAITLLTTIALCVASLIGLFAYSFSLEAYWSSYGGHAYVNILPSEPAAAYTDASKFVFADEARLDVSHALGYMDGRTYCVAPILDDTPTGTAQFWAAGQNCCSSRNSFTCDDAWNPEARSGLVIHSAAREHYMKAVRQAEAAFQIVSAESPIFVNWVVDPERLEMNYWGIGVGILVVAIVAHLITMVVTAYLYKEEAFKASRN